MVPLPPPEATIRCDGSTRMQQQKKKQELANPGSSGLANTMQSENSVPASSAPYLVGSDPFTSAPPTHLVGSPCYQLIAPITAVTSTVQALRDSSLYLPAISLRSNRASIPQLLIYHHCMSQQPLPIPTYSSRPYNHQSYRGSGSP